MEEIDEGKLIGGKLDPSLNKVVCVKVSRFKEPEIALR